MGSMILYVEIDGPQTTRAKEAMPTSGVVVAEITSIRRSCGEKGPVVEVIFGDKIELMDGVSEDIMSFNAR